MYVTCTCKRILTTSRGPTTNREIIPARAPAVACRTALLPFFLVLPPDSGITAPPMLVGEEKKKKRSGEEGCGVASPFPPWTPFHTFPSPICMDTKIRSRVCTHQSNGKRD